MPNEIQILTTGTVDGYEEYHNDYFLNGVKVGRSSYDKNQKLHIGVMPTSRKNLYAKTPEGISHKMYKLLTAKPEASHA